MNEQPNNPLHGMTLEAIINALVNHYGWGELGIRVKIRCFNADPSLKSSLKFLRKTPWARTKVEQLYLTMLADQKRRQASPWAKLDHRQEGADSCRASAQATDSPPDQAR